MIKSAFIYLFGGVLNRAIPFLLLPVLTRYLSPEDYGTLSIYQVLIAFTVPFVGMNMHNNITRNFAKYEQKSMAKLIGVLIWLLAIITTIVGVIIFLWITITGTTLGIPPNWLMTLPVVAAFSVLHQFNLTVLRNQQLPIRFGFVETSNTFFNLTLSLTLIVWAGYDWQGRASGVALSAVCFGLYGLYSLSKNRFLEFNFNYKLVKEVLQVSLPLIPHAVGGVTIALSDRLFIDRLVGKDAVGLYAVGYVFGMIVNIFVEAFNRAWSPWFYRKMNEGEEKSRKLIVKYTYLYFVGILLVAMSLTSLSYLVLPFIVSAEYHSSSIFIIWISLGYAFRGMYTMVFPYYVYSGKTKILGVGMFSVALINIVLNYVLIQSNGAVGAAQATLVSWLALFILTWLFSTRICLMPWTSYSAR